MGGGSCFFRPAEARGLFLAFENRREKRTSRQIASFLSKNCYLVGYEPTVCVFTIMRMKAPGKSILFRLPKKTPFVFWLPFLFVDIWLNTCKAHICTKTKKTEKPPIK